MAALGSYIYITSLASCLLVVPPIVIDYCVKQKCTRQKFQLSLHCFSFRTIIRVDHMYMKICFKIILADILEMIELFLSFMGFTLNHSGRCECFYRKK